MNRRTCRFSMYATVGMTLSTLFALVFSVAATAQSLTPISRAICEQALQNTIDASGGLLSPDADLNVDGIREIEAIGCFCEQHASGLLSPEVVGAFDSNIAIIDSLDGDIELSVPGFDIVAAYWSMVICDSEGDATNTVIDIIDSFASSVLAPGLDGDPNTGDLDPVGTTFLAEAGLNCSFAEEIELKILCCFAIISLSVAIEGPAEVVIGVGPVSYDAVTFEPPPCLSGDEIIESHTFTSSNPGVLSISSDGTVATAHSVGSATIEAVGDTSLEVGFLEVTTRGPVWNELCELDTDFDVMGTMLGAEIGCEFTGTPFYFESDFDMDGDGVRDAWQMQLAAFAICQGESGATFQAGGPDPAGIYASYLANLTLMGTYFDDLRSMDRFAAGDGGTTVAIEPDGGIVDFSTTPASESLQLGAESSDGADLSFTWASTVPGEATVDANGLVAIAATATPGGSAVITATGDSSGAMDSATVTMFDLDSQNRVGVSGGGDFCIEEGVIQLSAVTVGADSGEGHTWMSSDVGMATVDASGEVTVEVGAVDGDEVTITATGLTSSVVGMATIALHGCTGPCDEAKSGHSTRTLTGGQLKFMEDMVSIYLSGGGMADAMDLGIEASVSLIIGGMQDFEGSPVTFFDAVKGVEDVADKLLVLDGSGEWFAAYAGTGFAADTVMETFLNADDLFGAGGLEALVATTLPSYVATIDNTSGLQALLIATEAGVTTADFSTTTDCSGGPCLGLEALLASVTAANADLSANPLPTYASLDFDVFVSGSGKSLGAALEGDEVYAPGTNPSDLTNAAYHALVTSGGGDSNEYVNLASGIDLKGSGSPFVPLAGALALGFLIGGMIAAGGLRLRGVRNE